MTQLETQIEKNKLLAKWLEVDEVVLIREDLLPDGGGKKRRALASIAGSLSKLQHVHLLSYAGSHTAFTLSQLLPDLTIHLYGTHYGGGAYEDTMVKILNAQANVVQRIGSTLAMTREFNRQKRKLGLNHHFMKIGGHIDSDPITEIAIEKVLSEIGNDYQHFVAVASGDLLKCIQAQTDKVTGILTQPFGIRLLKSLTLKSVRGLARSSLDHRIDTMREIQKISGNLWDPIFMGAVFSHLKKQKNLPPKLCIWITCPSRIDWI